MTRTEALRELRDLTGRRGMGRHSDADLLDFLEQAQGEIAGLGLADERLQLITQASDPRPMTHGQVEYPMRPSWEDGGLGLTGALLITAVHWDGEALVRATPEQFPEIDMYSTGRGTPTYYYEFAGYLGFIPSPSDDAMDAFSCAIHYAAWPDAWAEGESTLHPLFQAFIVPWAAIKVYLRERRWAFAGQQFVSSLTALHETVLLNARRLTHRRDLPQPPTQRRRARR